MTDYLRAVVRTLTWRQLFVLQVLGLIAIYLVSRETRVFAHTSEHYVAMILNVFLLAPIAVIANEAVNRGARPRTAYSLAVASTIPVAFLSMALVQWLYLALVTIGPGTPAVFWKSVFLTTLQLYPYGAFGMLVYMNRRTADRLLDNFRNAELQRAQLEQQLAESRLATAESQIDPGQLFAELANIKRSLEQGRARAEDELADLIQTLRTAMARTTAQPDAATRQR